MKTVRALSNIHEFTENDSTVHNNNTINSKNVAKTQHITYKLFAANSLCYVNIQKYVTFLVPYTVRLFQFEISIITL